MVDRFFVRTYADGARWFKRTHKPKFIMTLDWFPTLKKEKEKKNTFLCLCCPVPTRSDGSSLPSASYNQAPTPLPPSLPLIFPNHPTTQSPAFLQLPSCQPTPTHPRSPPTGPWSDPMLPSGQLAILAASVVLFAPMGLAGLHLSRTKMLFFSGILFIFLFVAVHLAPYFLSISHLLLASVFFPSPPPFSLLPPSSCLPFLHRISWTHAPDPAWSWDPSAPVRSCGFQCLSNQDASILLNGSWILVAGDSQARLLVLALLRLLLDPTSLASIEPDLFKRHSDYHIAIADRGIKIDFLWAPYERNITDLLVRNIQPVPPYPDVMVLGSGLWHMLHFTNSSNYGESVNHIKEAVFSLHSPVLPHMFWLGLPTLISSKLNTQEKRERMTDAMLERYGREVAGTKILRQSGGPLMLLDVRWLSRGCGARCTDDGMHYNGVVYNAALQIMLNALVIESQQRIE